MQAFRKFFSVKRTTSAQILSVLSESRSATAPTMTNIRNIADFGAEEKRKFNDYFPVFLNVLMDKSRKMNIPEAETWFEKILRYNLLGGRNHRAFVIIQGYKEFAAEVTKEGLYLAYMVSWCTEMLHSSYLMIDDILDNATQRRGQPTWYRTNVLGSKALLDAVLMKMINYEVFVDYLGSKPYFTNFMKLYHDTEYMTLIGQFLDLANADVKGKPRLHIFTMERFNQVAILKASHDTTIYPIATALYLSGICNPDVHRRLRRVLYDIGILYQAENDFVDCFKVPNESGIAGGDIQDGKCTWPVVMALERANTSQKKLLEDCYGQPDNDQVKAVMNLYYELELDKEYIDYAQKFYAKIQGSINDLPPAVPRRLFHNLLDTMIQIK